MLRNVASKVMWVGRATVFMVGVAVILALAVGVVSRATAHTGSAGLFHLNHNNPVTALSTLTGTLTGAVLKVDNNGTGSALSLETNSGQAPLRVNATAGKATNLDADMLDGKDASSFASTNSEAWHEVGAPGEPQFTLGGPFADPLFANWTDVWGGPGYNTVGFYKDSMGIVHLKGRLTVADSRQAVYLTDSCPSDAFFKLPPGYRPAAIEVHPALGDVPGSAPGTYPAETGAPVQVRILPTTGEVAICHKDLIYVRGWVSLDGISFRAAN